MSLSPKQQDFRIAAWHIFVCFAVADVDNQRAGKNFIHLVPALSFPEDDLLREGRNALPGF